MNSNVSPRRSRIAVAAVLAVTLAFGTAWGIGGGHGGGFGFYEPGDPYYAPCDQYSSYYDPTYC